MENINKFRVWDKEEKKYLDKRTQCVINRDGVLCVEYEIEKFIKVYDDRYIVEKSTGLKDQNGKLIYVGDKLISPGGYIGVIKFGLKKLPSETDGHESVIYTWFYFDVLEEDWVFGINEDIKKYEIVGNIHEQNKGE